MKHVRHFRELRTYQNAREAAGMVFDMSKSFPKEERYSLTDQIRRASRAVKALIGEAWGRRRYKASFAHKLVEALGEANEVQSWLDDILDCGYADSDWVQTMMDRYQAICSMISRMIDHTDEFCPNDPDADYRASSVREPLPDSEWFIDNPRSAP
ncbi:MAG: four helix bundle protein [Verrucomicrobiaceae bacterium]|nr:four helix bundle protein [Verrucomicrobiaceae bacterium]